METVRKDFKIEPGKPSMESLAQKLESRKGLISPLSRRGWANQSRLIVFGEGWDCAIRMIVA